MRRTVELTAVLVLAASLTLVACGDQTPTGPFTSPATPFFTRPPAEGFDVLRRDVPLPAELSVTQVVGPDGGQLVIEGAGFMLVIPPNALTKPTTITMTAVVGDAMAVEFAPHGLEFNLEATLRVSAFESAARQNLRGKLDGETLESFVGVYYEGDPQVGVEALQSIAAYLFDGAIVFGVGHFSGYVVATG